MTTSNSLRATHCPQWNQCSAPVCPADSDWPQMDHFPEEEACPFLMEAAKGSNGVPPTGKNSQRIMEAAEAVWRRKELLPFSLRKKLVRASKSGSRRECSNLIASAA